MPRPTLTTTPDGRLQLTSTLTVTQLPALLAEALNLAADYIDGVSAAEASQTGCTTTDGREGTSALLRFVAELMPNEFQLRDGLGGTNITE